MTLTLRPVRHEKGDKNRFCGPAAISAVTGLTTGAAARLIRAKTGKRAVMGTHTWEVSAALKACGVNLRIGPGPRGVTLAAWLKATHGQRGGRVFLIAAGRHWQVISGNRYVCGKVGDVVGLDHKLVKRRGVVTEVHELYAPKGVVAPVAAQAQPRKQDTAIVRARSKARGLAAKHGLTIEREDTTSWWVWGPVGAYQDEDADPCAGERFCTSWIEVLEKVERYAADLDLRAGR